MNEFGPQSPPVGSAKIRLISTISKIRKDTESGKLDWKIIYKDIEYKVFSATIYYTESKYLTLYIRSSNVSKEKNNNSLKIMYKVKNDNINFYSGTVLSTIYLQEIPSLLSLIKLLWTKYLGLDFVPPYDIFRANKPNKKNIAVVKIDNVLEYRREILSSIRDYIRSLSKNIFNYKEIYQQIYDIHQKAEKSLDFNELNDYLYSASEIAKKNNPIGKPKWDTRPDDDDDQYE